MKGSLSSSLLISLLMNQLLFVATKSTRTAAASWIFSSSPVIRTASNRCGSSAVVPYHTTAQSRISSSSSSSSCQSTRQHLHDSSLSSLAGSRRTGWCVPIKAIQSQRSRQRRLVHNSIAIASTAAKTKMSMSTDGSDKSMKENTRNDDGLGRRNIDSTSFSPGDKILVEVISFGPMGASVVVIGTSHDPNDMIESSQPPLAKGLILQKEIQYFRQARGNIDVVLGEVLPAYVERVREISTGTFGDFRLDICLRSFGGKAKALELSDLILQRLNDSGNGRLDIGDKSTPDEILQVFPGISKKTFKSAVSQLYKLGKIQKPESYSISLIQQEQQPEK